MKQKFLGLLFSSAFIVSLASCTSTSSSSFNNSSSDEKTPYIDAYVSAVSDTAPILISGKYNSIDVDYVVSSYPVILQARTQSGKALTEAVDIAEEFGKKYQTDGFPQAGLFIKTSIENDQSQADNIISFLNSFDKATADLVNGGQKAVEYINSYNSDVEQQKLRFGFNAGVIKNSQAENKLAFITKEQNPSADQFKVFSEPLGVNIKEADLSKYYPTNMTGQTSETEMDELAFKVTSPQGAPASAVAKYASSTNLEITQPAQVQAAFTKGESDFIIFDSVNGLKLSAKNGNNYKLVRMVTYGNLYVVSTGNDEDNKFSSDDYIVSYGQGLVPDLAFKAVYGE